MTGCKVTGCDRKLKARGWCELHYQRWRKTGTVELIPRPPKEPKPDPVCPMCGPYPRALHDSIGACPTCEMTPGEHAYRARILADSDAVYRQEWAEYRAAREQARVS